MMTDTRNRNGRAANGAKNFYISILIFCFKKKLFAKNLSLFSEKISALKKF